MPESKSKGRKAPMNRSNVRPKSPKRRKVATSPRRVALDPNLILPYIVSNNVRAPNLKKMPSKLFRRNVNNIMTSYNTKKVRAPALHRLQAIQNKKNSDAKRRKEWSEYLEKRFLRSTSGFGQPK